MRHAIDPAERFAVVGADDDGSVGVDGVSGGGEDRVENDGGGFIVSPDRRPLVEVVRRARTHRESAIGGDAGGAASEGIAGQIAERGEGGGIRGRGEGERNHTGDPNGRRRSAPKIFRTISTHGHLPRTPASSANYLATLIKARWRFHGRISEKKQTHLGV